MRLHIPRIRKLTPVTRLPPIQQLASKSRNMSRYPIVLKDYEIVAYFARRIRYNEQALVYSGLLACNAGLASENAACTAAYGLKDRPQ
jgi:hypothetical protein